MVSIKIIGTMMEKGATQQTQRMMLEEEMRTSQACKRDIIAIPPQQASRFSQGPTHGRCGSTSELSQSKKIGSGLCRGAVTMATEKSYEPSPDLLRKKRDLNK